MAAPVSRHPYAFTVDTHTDYPPPLPPKPVLFHKRTSVAQPLLFALVALALFGMAVEACFIYRLYTKESSSVSDAQQISHQVAGKPTPRSNPVMSPSKPLGHVTGNQKPAANGVMPWNDEGDAIIHEMDYKDGHLIIQKEGYYFVYSKIFFAETCNLLLLHSVVRTTDRYPRELLLLQSSEHHPCQPKPNKNVRTNSYLGGMFHLFEGDAIFVRVNNTQIILSTSAENYFGAYMV